MKFQYWQTAQKIYDDFICHQPQQLQLLPLVYSVVMLAEGDNNAIYNSIKDGKFVEIIF
jgi:hypothetical protein